MACDLDALKTSACSNGFMALAQNEAAYRAIMLELLCQISNGGAGGGGLTGGDYGGGEPNFTPATDFALAVDTSTGTLWIWYDSAWH